MRPGKYFEVLLHFRGVKEGTVACQRGQAALLAAGDELGDAGLVPDGLDPGAGQQHVDAGQAHPLALQRQADWAPLHCTVLSAVHWRQEPEIWNTPRRQGRIRPRSPGGRK